MRKFFAFVRHIRLIIRSHVKRAYLKLAHPNIDCHSTVLFGSRVIIQSFDGGVIEIGAGTMIHEDAFVLAQGGRLRIGERCLIGRGSVVACNEAVDIGDGTLIAEYVTIRDQDHRHDIAGGLDAGGMVSSPIRIGNDVWIGAKATITRGVEIAARSVIGANSVVTRPITARGVYVGAPARCVRPL